MAAAAKTLAAALDKWLSAARAAACTRIEVLTPKGAVIASMPLGDVGAEVGAVTGESVLEHASDDAAADWGRRIYRARIYDAAGFREERRIIVDGGAASEEEAEDSGGSARPSSERAVIGHLSGLVESTVREMRCMYREAVTSLTAARTAENVARASWGDLLNVQLSMATLQIERDTARAEVERKGKRDVLFAEHFGPGARALVGYLTGGKAVPVNDSVRKLFQSLMSDEKRAAQVMALLQPHEQADLLAIGQFFDGEDKSKTVDAAEAPHANGAVKEG
jgi:hypothetical protein